MFMDEEARKQAFEKQSKKLGTSRYKKCLDICFIDSIRAKSTLGLMPPPSPPDDQAPPEFPITSTQDQPPSTATPVATKDPPSDPKISNNATTTAPQLSAQATAPQATAPQATAPRARALDPSKNPVPQVCSIQAPTSDPLTKSIDTTDAVKLLWKAVHACFV